jgi:hypothetical protein
MPMTGYNRLVQQNRQSVQAILDGVAGVPNYIADSYDKFWNTGDNKDQNSVAPTPRTCVCARTCSCHWACFLYCPL